MIDYKMTMKSEDIFLEISKEEIDAYISNHFICGSVQFLGYEFDEAGNICGIKGAADLGHGYGFSNGFKKFTIKFGETFSFVHDYTSIEGPSDWVDGSFKVILNLIKLDD